MKHQQIKEIFSSYGWKCTAQRFAVYEFIADNLNHPGVDEVWAHIKQTLPTVTRESVYRILNEFAEVGLIHRLNHIDSARYDSRVSPHGHFVCEICEELTDFDWPQGATIPRGIFSGEANHIEIRIVGRCKKCATKA